MEGNIYDLMGNFIGTTDGDGTGEVGEGEANGNNGDSKIIMDGDN